MTKFWRIKADQFGFTLIGWLVAANLFVWLAHASGWWPFKVLLFISLSLLPGIVMLRCLQIAPKVFSVGLLYCFGLSLLVLMVSGLAANQLLHAVGVVRPLELGGVLGMWNLVTALLLGVAIFTNKRPVRLRRWPVRQVPWQTWLIAGLTALLPLLVIGGAIRLNNGGDGTLALFALGWAAALVAAVFVLRRRIPSELVGWFVFVLGLSILLMTSLRGWDVVGHDIERELRVFNLAHQAGFWDIALDRDPYNACLSITILPSMLATLLDVSGLVVFKILLQFAFALCPVVVYFLLRRYVPMLAAFTGSMLFICYPTFINDAAMLTRQGVAYLFFALALYVLAAQPQKLSYKALFVLFSLGAVLSHYSTAYMFVAMFVLALICKRAIVWWTERQKRPLPRLQRLTMLTPFFGALLFLMTFLWYSQITGTSRGLVATLQKSIANIPSLFSEESKSADTSTALLFAGGKTQADLYQSYLQDSQSQNALPEATEANYIPILISDDLPLTWLGERLRVVGIDPSFINVLRHNFARVLQVLALAAVVFAVYLLFKRRREAPNLDIICVSVAAIVVLALMVVLPVLSISYGILRAFQQALIFLIVPMTILLIQLTRRFGLRLKLGLASSGVVVVFLLFTGVFAQVLGGVGPSLTMNNQGLYYSLYYAPEADKRAFAWLKQNIPRNADVRAANFNRALMRDPHYPFNHAGILPTQIGQHSLVYLDAAQVQAKKVHVYHESSPITMTFPLEYYDLTKDQIYSTTTTRVYQ